MVKIFKGWSIFWTLLPALQHDVVPKKETMKSKRVVRSWNVQHFNCVAERKKKKHFEMGKKPLKFRTLVGCSM